MSSSFIKACSILFLLFRTKSFTTLTARSPLLWHTSTFVYKINNHLFWSPYECIFYDPQESNQSLKFLTKELLQGLSLIHKDKRHCFLKKGQRNEIPPSLNVTMNALIFFKCEISGLFFVYFRLFKPTLKFLQQINVKNVHPVYDAGI